MLPEVPSDLRPILPYIQRASEVRAREPAMAYFCEFHAANLAVSRGFPRGNPQNESFLVALFDHLETAKRSLAGHAAFKSPRASRQFVMEFADRVFLAADDEDRAGRATKKTAKMFLVASHFYEVAKGAFSEGGDGSNEAGGTWSVEAEDRLRYARWKAMDIVKALNEGRQPLAGPPPSVSEMDTASPASAHTTVDSPPVADASPPTADAGPPRTAPFAAAAPVSGPVQPAYPTMQHLKERAQTLTDAEKYARHGLSAIQFEDVSAAVQNLQRAVQLLQSLKF